MSRDTYTRLLETAMDLIWHSNYNSVGINDICKQAGVTKGGFYHHFESKANLFCEATNYYWNTVKGELDSLLSPSNTPLEQLENMINFIFAHKFGDDPNNVPGCPFVSAGCQTGLDEAAINGKLVEMAQNSHKYSLALVRNLHGAGYLDGEVDVERVARLINQYIQGAVSYARISRDIAGIKHDVPEALYRLLGLKREYWFATQATWQAKPCCLEG
ncbi:MAG TPA: TetR/AcrR family transcriptional regulator [Hyphomicrobiales bacterium]|nr:TetR/AcrR family transcriptional regulator [Hyphomicrobiales bacterium]